jgi:hypothetical protein
MRIDMSKTFDILKRDAIIYVLKDAGCSQTWPWALPVICRRRREIFHAAAAVKF